MAQTVTTDPTSTLVDQLTARAEGELTDPCWFDETVHELASGELDSDDDGDLDAAERAASRVNNDGFRAQVTYLLEQGVTGTEVDTLIDRLAARKRDGHRPW